MTIFICSSLNLNHIKAVKETLASRTSTGRGRHRLRAPSGWTLAHREHSGAGISKDMDMQKAGRVRRGIRQAPGAVAEETRIPWNDKSGERLRDWLGVSRETFYDPERVALLPMDFYFPGHGRSGDLPPRKGFAEQWHPALLALMPNVRLTVLVGAYAFRRYLHLKNSDSLTTVVRDYDAYIGRGFFPLVHPSPRNQLWMSRNPWFEAETLPALKAQVNAALEQR